MILSKPIIYALTGILAASVAFGGWQYVRAERYAKRAASAEAKVESVRIDLEAVRALNKKLKLIAERSDAGLETILTAEDFSDVTPPIIIRSACNSGFVREDLCAGSDSE